MSRKPSIAEIGAFLGHLKATREQDADSGPLLAEKANILERIAEANPDDLDAAQIAREARAAADRAQRNNG
ncbi:hypothetical protein [Streptomyces rubellomurinus]|uniref:Uncharacterized protein n=1 Tax=Streptomyces rubellomurinus (strain ATCC 31215) TaxID=359131 RepID=A0A0F2T7X1_STRR3|nr:hypothetical protein [Streptomyces rubellomurinus]KJS58486.1 hypothetical protein VM95_33025 [Streptomyces rubellomurinus]